MFGTRHSVVRMREEAALFPRILEIAQPDVTRRDSTVDGMERTLSRIDRTFINLPVAEARYSHVFENLGRTVHTE